MARRVLPKQEPGRRSILGVARGHEIWVLPEVSHVHEGREARCRVYWGHAMRPDGIASLNRLSAWIVAPGGERFSLKVEPTDDRFHLVRYTPDREGFWTVVVEDDMGPIVTTTDGSYRPGTRKEYPDARQAAYHYQYAKTYMQVGHLRASCGGEVQPVETACLGCDLELIVAPGIYRVGDAVILEVRYRGRPLSGAEVTAAWSLREEEDWALVEKTDAAGRVKFFLGYPGHWVFYAHYVDETQKSEGEYDSRVYGATLSLFGVR